MKNKKTDLVVIFMKVLYLIMIILLFCIVGVLIQMNRSHDDKEKSDVSKTEAVKVEDEIIFALDFPGCELLNSKCLGTECDQYFLCGDKKYSVCEIYDCGEEFGIGTKDENGKIEKCRKMKEDREKIVRIKDKCRGTVEALESDCVDEKLEIKVKVITNGDCRIEGFWVGHKNKENGEKISSKPVKFSSLGGKLYLVATDSCEEISELIAIGENGISIR